MNLFEDHFAKYDSREQKMLTLKNYEPPMTYPNTDEKRKARASWWSKPSGFAATSAPTLEGRCKKANASLTLIKENCTISEAFGPSEVQAQLAFLVSCCEWVHNWRRRLGHKTPAMLAREVFENLDWFWVAARCMLASVSGGLAHCTECFFPTCRNCCQIMRELQDLLGDDVQPWNWNDG